ncbi:type II toxin-antitoxin system VapC family toxin [Komarekiella sp. 'clone 1']|uniref:Type II toxin-antitoxin system VapC family toxin n=1 Tax=Komarekiella delphini-convector SJRDD-AB1 TaxID=2593771 RepID=A0AA40SZX3_9NOST|nr:type II toxin-antitoxin system VapC family toxin [Komarekiella delphini-convector SJRDD-AB1]
MLLLDTSGLLCYIHSGEPEHQKAIEFLDSVSESLTHSYVLAEFIALAQVRRFPRTAALIFMNDLLENPDIETVWINELLHREAVKLLVARQDKTYSLCDAVSFVLMRQRGVTDALTTDHHFEQEGCRRLLLPQA